MQADTYSLITTRAEFVAALRDAIGQAEQTGARELFFVDPDFAEWPLNDAAVIETLAQWVATGRKLVVYAANFDDMARRQLRFVEWRRTWTHVVQCRSDEEIEADNVPSMLLAAGEVGVRLVDRVRFRGSASTRAVDLVECRETIDALLQRSSETFPATTLGL